MTEKVESLGTPGSRLGGSRLGGLRFGQLREYLAERFPVPVTLVLSAAIGFAAYAAAQGATLRAGAPLLIDGAAIGGVFMSFLFLFLLRVYDEHKDYDQDLATRPDRPVQRGLITLAQLRTLGAVAVAAQVALALPYGLEAAAVYGVVLGYSVLMYVEFFAREWLSARLVWYALSHTLVMSLLALALGMRFTLRADVALPVELIGFLVLSIPAFLSIDVLRKIYAPENEIDGVDTYSKAIGYRGSALLASALLVADAAIAGWLGVRLGGSFAWVAVCIALTAWAVYECFAFARRPVADRQKRLELVAGVHLLVLFFGIAVVAGVEHGAVWGL